MKPDKKYMSLTNDDIIFDTFEVESPFCDLNYGLTPIVNIESNTFRTLEPCDEEEDLRKSSIDNALGGSEELILMILKSLITLKSLMMILCMI